MIDIDGEGEIILEIKPKAWMSKQRQDSHVRLLRRSSADPTGKPKPSPLPPHHPPPPRPRAPVPMFARLTSPPPRLVVSDLVQNLVAEGMPVGKANELCASLLEQGRLRRLRETRPTGMARKDARRPSGAGDARRPSGAGDAHRPQEPVTLAGEQTRRSGAGVLEAFWSLQAAHRRRRGGGS